MAWRDRTTVCAICRNRTEDGLPGRCAFTAKHYMIKEITIIIENGSIIA